MQKPTATTTNQGKQQNVPPSTHAHAAVVVAYVESHAINSV